MRIWKPNVTVAAVVERDGRLRPQFGQRGQGDDQRAQAGFGRFHGAHLDGVDVAKQDKKTKLS